MKDLTSTSKRNQKVERFLQHSLPSPSLCSTLLDHHTAFNCSTLTFKADIALQNRNVEGVRMCGGEEEMAYQWFMGCAGAGGLCAWLNASAEKWVKKSAIKPSDSGNSWERQKHRLCSCTHWWRKKLASKVHISPPPILRGKVGMEIALWVSRNRPFLNQDLAWFALLCLSP